MAIDENIRTLIELQAALTDANKNPPPPPDPKQVWDPLSLVVAKALPPAVVKQINVRGAQLTGRATDVAKAQKLVNKVVADALQRVGKIVGV